jgi:hypothetical protein
MTHGKGFRPVPAGRIEDQWHQHPKAARAGQASPDSDWTVYLPPGDDQNGCSQCTGHAVTGADMTTLSAAGRPVNGYLDPQAAYRLARCMERAQWYPWNGGQLPTLQDNGADPNLVHLAGSKYGFARTLDTFGLEGPCQRLTECYAMTVNGEPMIGELESSDEFKLLGQFRVQSTGQQRIADVRAALASRFAVTLSVYASDERFQGYCGGLMPPKPEGADDDHLIFCYGCFTDATGATVFLCQNSWGVGYGMSGRLWLHQSDLVRSTNVHVASVSQQ